MRSDISEASNPACSDGCDNDNGGLIDMLDPGCEEPNDSDESHVAQCNDGIDNNADGLIDFPQDVPICGSQNKPSPKSPPAMTVSITTVTALSTIHQPVAATAAAYPLQTPMSVHPVTKTVSSSRILVFSVVTLEIMETKVRHCARRQQQIEAPDIRI